MIPDNTQYHELFIPTSHSIRYTQIAEALLIHNFAVMLSGKTGTSKTKLAKRLLLNELNQEKFIATMTAFSANTLAT